MVSCLESVVFVFTDEPALGLLFIWLGKQQFCRVVHSGTVRYLDRECGYFGEVLPELSLHSLHIQIFLGSDWFDGSLVTDPQ